MNYALCFISFPHIVSYYTCVISRFVITGTFRFSRTLFYTLLRLCVNNCYYRVESPFLSPRSSVCCRHRFPRASPILVFGCYSCSLLVRRRCRSRSQKFDIPPCSNHDNIRLNDNKLVICNTVACTWLYSDSSSWTSQFVAVPAQSFQRDCPTCQCRCPFFSANSLAPWWGAVRMAAMAVHFNRS